MHLATMLSFQDELEKIALLGPALDIAGLGALGVPVAHTLMSKKAPKEEKTKAKWEAGGLGLLGASVAAEHAGDALKAGKSGLSKLRGLASKMPKHAAEEKKDHTLRNTALAVGGLTAATVGGMKALKNHPNEWEKLRRAQASAKGIATNLLSKAKHAAPTMGAMMNMHRLADAAKAAKGVAKPMAQAAGKALTNPNNMGRASHLAANVATGGHAWNPAAAAKRAISL